MRRALLSDLNIANVKDSHVQRLAGHVAGGAVLHRHYLLDDARLRPGRDIADIVERELRAQLTHGLMVPTTVPCSTGNQQALVGDAPRIDAVLADHGWLVAAKDGDEFLVGADEVGRILGLSVQTARRWMAQGRVPSVMWSTRARGTERRARVEDVMKVQAELDGRVSMRDLADELGFQYHAVYQFVRAHDLPVERTDKLECVVPTGTAEQVRTHFSAQRALSERALSWSQAAAALQVSVGVVQRLVADGVLVEDERAASGSRMVTRASVRSRASTEDARPTTQAGLMEWSRAGKLLGATDDELELLVRAGDLVVGSRRRKRFVTQSSVLRVLVERRPDLVLRRVLSGE